MYALIFPGQASQQVGMGSDFRASPEGVAIFDAADEASNLPLSKAIAEGPLERLTDTLYAQPAVVATSLAALLALRQRLAPLQTPEPAYCAGHSVGEIAAIVAAGSLEVRAGLNLVATRARLMAEACRATEGTMAAVIGVSEEPLQRLCDRAASETGASVEIANLNAPDQLVVSGHRSAVSWLLGAVKNSGAGRVIPLNVGGPFHSRYLRSAAEAFAQEIGQISFRPARIPVVLNQTARPAVASEALRAELATQITAPVRWADSIRFMADSGCSLFIEVGPGQVLGGLVRRTVPGVKTVSVSDRVSLEVAVEAILASGERR